MTAPIRVALLDEQIPAQLRERPTEADGLDVVWSGTDLEDLLRFTAKESPTIIVADLDRLGPDPETATARLLTSSNAELLITVYKFAPRAVVERLTGQNRRVVKAPVSIAMLKTQMLSTIVRSLLAQPSTNVPTVPPVRRATPLGRAEPTPVGEPARYTDTQLGTLRERASSMACECPNHVAELVTSLLAFERYSRGCANRNDADARMHRQLAEATQRARRTMEDALTELLAFENITV